MDAAADLRSFVLVTTLTVNNGSKADGGASASPFVAPLGLAVGERLNRLFVSDHGSHQIYTVDLLSNRVHVLAGGRRAGSADGKGDLATFHKPAGLCLDSHGDLLVCDSGNHKIRKVTLHAVVTSVAGGSSKGFLPGLADVAQFSAPYDICLARNGSILVSDSDNHRIRVWNSDSNFISTYAGEGKNGYQENPRKNCLLDYPLGMAVDENGVLFVADNHNNCIRVIQPNESTATTTLAKIRGVCCLAYHYGNLYATSISGSQVYQVLHRHRLALRLLAGTGSQDFADGRGHLAAFKYPCGICCYQNSLFVADWGNRKIRRLLLPADCLSPPLVIPQADRHLTAPASKSTRIDGHSHDREPISQITAPQSSEQSSSAIPAAAAVRVGLSESSQPTVDPNSVDHSCQTGHCRHPASQSGTNRSPPN